VSERQHIWVGPDTTSFESSCESCLSHRGGRTYDDTWSLAVDAAQVEGTLRRDADVGFTTCRRGHRIVVHRVGRSLARAV
jgi:hypothetical protein